MHRSSRRVRGAGGAIRAAATLVAVLAVVLSATAGCDQTASPRGDRAAAAANTVPSPSRNPRAAGFPSAATTGVSSPLSALTAVPGDIHSGPGWSWANGCVEVHRAGTRISRLDVQGCIEVEEGADDVTISDSRVTATGDGWGIGARDVRHLVVQDVTISGGGALLEVGVKDVTGSSSITVLRCDIADWTSGVQASRGLVQDSFIHSPRPGDGSYHLNGFTDNGGRPDGSMVLRHNTILNSRDQTDAISFFQDFGGVQNVVVDHNLIAGGAYSLYAGAKDDGVPTHRVVITNNRISTRYFRRGGVFGPACCFDQAPGNVWSGNVWADGPRAGRTIPPP